MNEVSIICSRHLGKSQKAYGAWDAQVGKSVAKSFKPFPHCSNAQSLHTQQGSSQTRERDNSFLLGMSVRLVTYKVIKKYFPVFISQVFTVSSSSTAICESEAAAYMHDHVTIRELVS